MGVIELPQMGTIKFPQIKMPNYSINDYDTLISIAGTEKIEAGNGVLAKTYTTIDKLKEYILSGFSVIRSYEVNDLDDAGSGVTYIGKADTDGNWIVERITESGNDLSKDYANISNNAGQANYTDAWTNRLTLTFQEFHNLTIS